MQELTPKEIVSKLDRHIVGQDEAKRAVAIAIRNRWRRMMLPKNVRDEIIPKNILMIGPTGVGKTEIARRLAKITDSPFVKVEATKFTEIGYVGRDVEQIIRDLLDSAINMLKKKKYSEVREKAYEVAKQRVLDVLVGENASDETRSVFAKKMESAEFCRTVIEIDLPEQQQLPFAQIDIPGGQLGMMNIGELIGKGFNSKESKLRKVTIVEALDILTNDEAENMMDKRSMISEAIQLTENSGIVFIDEIDKICSNSSSHSRGEVSREGVQRDLLPLVEGTAVSTKHGVVHTDFILFVASGAFHTAKPSDLLPELQGRFPIRVKLNSLTKQDFIKILTEPEMNLLEQAKYLLSTENVKLKFTDEAVEEIANIATTINEEVENIGARRLHTIIWQILDDISFNADSMQNEEIVISKDDVCNKVKLNNIDNNIARFIL